MKQRVLVPAKKPEKPLPEVPHDFLVVKDFKAVNTKADRTAIDKEQFAWLENIMPKGFGNLQVIATYVASSTVIWAKPVSSWFAFTMIGAGLTTDHDFIIAFENDGSCQIYDITINSLTTLATAGTFSTSGVRGVMWSDTTFMILDPLKGLYSFIYSVGVVPIGSVGLIAITAGGSAYTSAPTVNISAPNVAGGIQAVAEAVLVGAVVSQVILTQAGSGYTSPPTITFTGGGGTGATAIASIINFAANTVGAVDVLAGGSGYTSAPTVTIAPTAGSTGTGATATAVISAGAVTEVVITNGGSNWTGTATVTFTGGAGTGAKGQVILQTSKNIAIEAFSSRIWVAAGRTVSYSAAGQYNDFITVSAGSITITDSTLKGSITALLAANNFLQVFGSSAIFVFSDVNVNSNGQTVFTDTNISTSIGTIFPDAIFAYFRSVLFINQYGVFALVGATTSKISDDLDGVFKSIDFTAPIFAGQVLINEILCAAFNFRYLDPVLGGRYIQAVYFEKKWFFASSTVDQRLLLSTIVDGVGTVYGSNGISFNELYVDTVSPLNWMIKTALWPMEDVMATKQALRYAVEIRTGIQSAVLIGTVDNENTSAAPNTLLNAVLWINLSGDLVDWENNGTAIVEWLATGYLLYQADAEQYGKYLGMTLLGTAPQCVITGTQIEYKLAEPYRR